MGGADGDDDRLAADTNAFFRDEDAVREAIDREVGEAVGFVQTAYRKWCVQQPDLVVQISERQFDASDPTKLLRAVHPTTGELFRDYLEDPDNAPEAKSDSASASARDLGNDLYRSKNLGEALRSYTRAVLLAEPGSEALALAFANRSAVLFQLKEYLCCCQDVERALESGYPKKMRYKLHERKTKCLFSLGQIEQAQSALRLFVESLKDAELPPEKLNSMASDMHKLAEAAAKRNLGQNKQRPQLDLGYAERKVPRVPAPNPAFPAFSKCVSVQHDPGQGRHLRAARAIGAGELILAEDAAVSCAKRDVLGRVCTECLRETPNPIPSPISNKDVFCGPSCLRSASSSYLPFEARIRGLLDNAGLAKAEWFLALRAVTQRERTFFLEGEAAAAKHDERYGTGSSSDDPYLTQDFRSLFNLVTLRRKWPAETQLFKAFVVSFFLRCLRVSGYLDGTTDEEELKIGSFLTHFMEVATLNAHEVGAYCPDASSDPTATSSALRPLSSGSLRAVGSAVEPSLVLMNHSCDPAVLRVNVQGRATLGFASRDIKEGEEITDSYLPLGQSLPRDDRRERLAKSYFFDCACVPCFERWPPTNQLPRALNDVDPNKFKFSLDNVRMMQAQFGKIQKLGASINEEQKKARESKGRDRSRECFSLAVEFTRTLEETMDRPHQFYAMAARTMATALWDMHGSRISADAADAVGEGASAAGGKK